MGMERLVNCYKTTPYDLENLRGVGGDEKQMRINAAALKILGEVAVPLGILGGLTCLGLIALSPVGGILGVVGCIALAILGHDSAIYGDNVTQAFNGHRNTFFHGVRHTARHGWNAFWNGEDADPDTILRRGIASTLTRDTIFLKYVI